MSDGITRRQVLVIGAVGAGALAVGATGLVATGLSSQVGPPQSGLAPGPGGGGWAEPMVLTSRDGVLDLDLRVAEADVVIGESTVRMLTYNGTVPGPTLHLRPGDRLRVRLRNELGEPTNLHTHGLRVSAAGNGDNPFLRIDPGQTFEYEIDLPADHPSGVFWYHPHQHGLVADQLFGGLYGAIIVDQDDWSDTAPRVVVVSDVTIAGGSVAQVAGVDRMLGRTGETLLTNGLVAPRLAAPSGSEQRLLVINACASRYLDMGLAGLNARLRGLDSGHRDEELVDRVLLVPGNRADLVFTTPARPVDLIAAGYDRGQAGIGMMGGPAATVSDAPMLTVTPDASASVPDISPPTPETHPDLRDVTVDDTRTITMQMGMGGGMRFLIDGRSFDPDRVDQQVSIGTVEEWTIRNTSPMDHPFHLHIWPMQIIRAEGAETAELDIRDVVDVPAGSSVVVRIAFDRFPGRTVYHCHILDHEDLGMMGVIEAG